MKLFSTSRRAILALVLSVLWAAPAVAQRIAIASATGSGTVGTISTAGADCTVATNCVSFSTDDIPSFGIDLDVGTSGTFQFEIQVNPDENKWRAWPDAVNGATNATVDGYYTFSNTGFRRFRVRASAISGAATVTGSKGYVPLRSTATLSGSISGNAAASATGAAVPASSDFQGISVAGTLRGATGFSVGSQFPQSVAIVDGSGNQITTFGGAGGTASNFAAAFPATGTAAGMSDGTNMVPLLGTATQADNLGNGLDGLNVTAFNYVFDGTTWDRWTGGVNLQIAGTPVSVGAGSVDAFTPRVTLAADDPSIPLLGAIADSAGDTAQSIEALNQNLGRYVSQNADPPTVAGPWNMVRYQTFDGSPLTSQTSTENWPAIAVGSDEGVQYVSCLTPDGSAICNVNISLLTSNMVPHDQPDAGNPIKVGGRAVSFGATPTAVAAADRFDVLGTRAGIVFTQPGHPNTIPFECQVEDADGAQTNAACVTVSAGTKIVVTGISAHCDASNTGPINVIVGFGTATLPARAHTGATGILLAVDGIIAGGGDNKGYAGGVVGVGADDEDIRFTMEDPAGGACSVEGSYYTIAG